MPPPPSPSFAAFRRLWLGQVASLLGSGMTTFALAILLWEATGQATPVILVGVIASLPALLLELPAGVWVDRWDRKRLLILSDLGSGLATGFLLIFFLVGSLDLWQIYLAAALAGASSTLQVLAFNTSITLLVAEKDYTRANGLMSLAQYLALVGAPLLAGALIPRIGVVGIFLIDIITFLFAVAVALATRIPPPTAPAENPHQDDSLPFFRQIRVGFEVIFRSPPLRTLLLVVLAFNAVEAVGYPLLAPMLLARTGGDETLLGTVQSVMGLAGILGGLIIGVWGGPRRRILGLLLGIFCTGLFGDALMGLGQGLLVWLIAAIGLEAFIPLAVSTNRALWQSHIEPRLQGRVFAASGFLNTLTEPLATIIGGLLADGLFEPALRPGGALVPLLGPLVGVGPGAGMAAIFVFSGAFLALLALAAALLPALRRLS